MLLPMAPSWSCPNRPTGFSLSRKGVEPEVAMGRQTPHPPSHHPARREGLEAGHQADPYRLNRKFEEPSACPDCLASYHKGHWSWDQPATGAQQHRCPACARIRDRVPAGELILSGEFLAGHYEQILALIEHTDAHIRAEHPLERLMAIQPDESHSQALVTFTGTHGTHGVAKALHQAFGGELEAPYPEGSTPLRVHWRR